MPETGIEAHDLGITWVMQEPMKRASHALVDRGRVWIVDPVYDEQAMERTGALGEPVAVLQLLDRHNRDCAAVANRFGVPHLRVPDAIADSPFAAIALVRRPFWKETALWWPENSALVVAEALGTSELFTVGQGPVGVHPLMRPFPPGRLRSHRPRNLLVGHGRPVLSGEATEGAERPSPASAGLERAYRRSRRDIPRVIRELPSFLRES